MYKHTTTLLSVAVAMTLVGAGCSATTDTNVNTNTQPENGMEANVNTNNQGMSPTDNDANTSTSMEGMQAAALMDGSYALVTEQSIINWTGRKTLIANYDDHGTINLKDGNFKVENGMVTEGMATFDMTTIKATSTGKGVGDFPGMLEKHLKSDDFFGVEKNPTATFKVKSVSMVEGNPQNYLVVGDLTIKGKTNEITVPATAVAEGEGMIRITAETQVDRTKFDIRYGSDNFFDNLGDNVIDDNFGVAFNLVAKKQ